MNKSYQEKRSVGRARAGIAVEILQGDLAGTIAETSDFSESGTLIHMSGGDRLQTGVEFKVRITGLMGQSPRVVLARVVRIDDQGVALKFNQPIEAD